MRDPLQERNDPGEPDRNGAEEDESQPDRQNDTHISVGLVDRGRDLIAEHRKAKHDRKAAERA